MPAINSKDNSSKKIKCLNSGKEVDADKAFFGRFASKADYNQYIEDMKKHGKWIPKKQVMPVQGE